jgi:hypothetical protein
MPRECNSKEDNKRITGEATHKLKVDILPVVTVSNKKHYKSIVSMQIENSPNFDFVLKVNQLITIIAYTKDFQFLSRLSWQTQII